jgi:hypothetical protein
MELVIDVNYDQVWRLVNQLPESDKRRLTKELERNIGDKSSAQSETQDFNELTDFQEFLLQGPTMSDGQLEDYKELRKNFDKWLAG